MSGATSDQRHPWQVRVHHRARVVFLALCMVVVSWHLVAWAPPAWVWLLVLLQFVVYPHVLHLWMRRATDGAKAAMRGLLFDALLLGAWSGALGGPLWIAFGLFVGTGISMAFTAGWRGAGRSTALFGWGLGLGVWLTPIGWRPDTLPGVTAVSAVGLALYVFFVGDQAHRRNHSVQRAREQLKDNERSMQMANEALLAQLEQIHALQSQLTDRANRDPLTGLYNRRYLMDTVERELARCHREQRPMVVMMLDVDHFKRVNDTHGHPVGDEVLRRLGALLLAFARTEDVACRYGGEEFLLLLPTMPLDVAEVRANQLRRDFSALDVVSQGERLVLTVSVGMASFPAHGRTAQDLMRNADIALYHAKNQGRNRVMVFDPTTMDDVTPS